MDTIHFFHITFFTPLGRYHCWWTDRGYHHPSSQHFGVDKNINYMVILINFLLPNFELFRKSKDFLIPGIDNLSRICTTFWNFWSSKSKITKILNSKENSKRKVHNQMAKSKIQTHQTNG